MNLHLILTFLGGVGLFLLGMRLMTDGLKVAAGDALREILARGTATTPRGIVSGIGITAVVQSSSAVIFATVGFVNAGLLTLFQAIGVIIGSNIGTTATSWLVALVGFKVDLQALALPAVAIGMLLRVTGQGKRRAYLGDALTGFGIFFLGLDVLKTAFGDFGQGFDLADHTGNGILSLLMFVAIGVVMTVVMNSSSASLAITLTAAGTGLIPLTAAAAMVIGANVGTTSTALFAVIGATSSAKRAAVAHVLFNVVVGIVAFVSLPALLWLVAQTAQLMRLEPGPATSLAIFHTTTKLLGMAIFWPLTPRLVSFLETRFRSAEEDEGQPRHLDRHIASTPDLALDALNMELKRIGEIARRGARDVVSMEGSAAIDRLHRDRAIVDRLILACVEFSNRAQYGEIPASIAEGFPLAMRISRYYGDIAEHVEEIAKLEATLTAPTDPAIAEALTEFRRETAHFLALADPDAEGFEMKPIKRAIKDFADDYQALKALLLRAGADDRLPVRQMVARLDELSHVRRIVDQSYKAAKYTRRLRKQLYQHRDEGARPEDTDTYRDDAVMEMTNAATPTTAEPAELADTMGQSGSGDRDEESDRPR
ncbi:Na/Pi symporter [Guyparkeria hydrothermalis]|uniref:Na/Pi cotransporter family protein n=1 Tax=Guyparkeria TaxID=2035712 RepID=UPI0010AD63AD|nr:MULTISPECIES: Na/Pi symporter [Guyparkeria]MCL7750080.1 Na/Pi symporter [Guyparkeria hydrothermalis]TKA88821.1 Na/Pi cotransporter family protein [Guyparkeria sp. SB14A]